MKKNMKSHKGMTLYECIISIAIFAIMCGILIGVGIHIDKTSKATNHLKAKIAAEAPVAANGNKTSLDGTKDATDLDITISVNGGAAKTYIEYDPSIKKGKEVTHNATNTIHAKKYTTERAYTGADPDKSADAIAASDGMLNLEFIDLKP